MDRMTKEQRSRCMSRIKGKNTKPEILVRKYLFGKGYRFRINSPLLPGRPDIVLRKYRTVIFVNGCFWHGHDGCRYFVLPKSNTDFWQSKIARNKERDRQELDRLAKLGWNCIVVWECLLKPSVREHTLQSINDSLKLILDSGMNKRAAAGKYTRICTFAEESGTMAAEPETAAYQNH